MSKKHNPPFGEPPTPSVCGECRLCIYRFTVWAAALGALSRLGAPALVDALKLLVK